MSEPKLLVFSCTGSNQKVILTFSHLRVVYHIENMSAIYTVGVKSQYESNTYCVVRPCVRDDRPRAINKWLSFVHTDEPYNEFLIALSALCAFTIKMVINNISGWKL